MDNRSLAMIAILGVVSLLASCAAVSSEIAFACGHISFNSRRVNTVLTYTIPLPLLFSNRFEAKLLSERHS